jgi:Mor family transcriptional regulator
MTTSTRSTDDIPSIVAQEISAAHQAGIPTLDQPDYIADRLRHRLSGSDLYIRKRALSPTDRAREIRARFNGRNIGELAGLYELSDRRIRQIVNEGGEIENVPCKLKP